MSDHDVETVDIPGGTFAMGSTDFYPEEAPVRHASVEAFQMDRAPVTNERFARFVRETGFVTVAERVPDPRDYPGADPRMLRAGSLVFRPTKGPVDLSDPSRWWAYVPGACWRQPRGPGSSITRRERHPVVHIAYEDALAFARWAGKSLPTEAEWERAARGGHAGRRYAWGDEMTVDGRHMANTWQGEFPWQNTGEDGYERTSPVGAFPANDYGLLDITGNVWEWTTDHYLAQREGLAAPACCAPPAPQVRRHPDGLPATQSIDQRTLRGGSHLCAPNYCLRFRPAARIPGSTDTSTSHIGFRCVRR